jgi:transposase-like protein
MPGRPSPHHRLRCQTAVIAHAVWLYRRVAPSFRDVEEPLYQGDIDVAHQAVRAWTARFGPGSGARLRKGQTGVVPPREA